MRYSNYTPRSLPAFNYKQVSEEKSVNDNKHKSIYNLRGIKYFYGFSG